MSTVDEPADDDEYPPSEAAAAAVAAAAVQIYPPESAISKAPDIRIPRRTLTPNRNYQIPPCCLLRRERSLDDAGWTSRAATTTSYTTVECLRRIFPRGMPMTHASPTPGP